MISLKVIRSVIDLRNGTKYKKVVFYATNTSKRVLAKIYDTLLTRDILEGGDNIICKENNKVFRNFYICQKCSKLPALKTKKLCKTCNASITENYPYIENNLDFPPVPIGILIKKGPPKILNPKPNPNANAKFYKWEPTV